VSFLGHNVDDNKDTLQSVSKKKFKLCHQRRHGFKVLCDRKLQFSDGRDTGVQDFNSATKFCQIDRLTVPNFVSFYEFSNKLKFEWGTPTQLPPPLIPAC